jgi:hypothetical protein
VKISAIYNGCLIAAIHNNVWSYYEELAVNYPVSDLFTIRRTYVFDQRIY